MVAHAREGADARRRDRGFTLIELMIAVAIVAIISVLAYPSYTGHLRKGHRAEAQAYIMDLAQREQQYFTDNRAYALDGGGTTAATLLHAAAPPADLASYYTIATTPRNVTPSFVVTATAIGSQAVDGNLSIDDTGAKTPAGNW